jgi:N-acetylmuramoyl-L-alanine amidase
VTIPAPGERRAGAAEKAGFVAPMRMRERLSPNCDERPCGRRPDMLILHYTGMRSAAEALDRLCDPAAQVSAHWLVEEDGQVWRLVPEELRAWHAGVSFWDGESGLNAGSIGIELVNPGHEFGYRPFPEPQMAALVALARGVVARWRIPPHRVLGHSDAAPRRKQDPGELFDWRRLAGEGIGLWPKPSTPVGNAADAAAAFGYEVIDPAATLAAFQRRFRPACVDSLADDETRSLLGGLLDLVGRRA